MTRRSTNLRLALDSSAGSIAHLPVSRGNGESSPALVLRAAVMGAILLCSDVLATSSRAGVVLTLTQSGGNVVGTLSGSITDLTGATLDGSGAAAFSRNNIRSVDSILQWTNRTPGAIGSYNTYNITTIPANFGTTSSTLSTASSSSASTSFILQGGNPALYMDVGYTLGTAVTGTLTWPSTTLSTMGIVPGSYVWSWAGDSVTLNAVPEPSASCMVLAGLALSGYSMFRRRNRA